MILLWIINDHKKFEKECKEKGLIPAMTLKERLFAYFLCIPLPIIVALLKILIMKVGN